MTLTSSFSRSSLCLIYYTTSKYRKVELICYDVTFSRITSGTVPLLRSHNVTSSDNSSTRNQGILDYCDNPTLNEISIRFPCSFLHVVAVNNLKKQHSLSTFIHENSINMDLFDGINSSKSVSGAMQSVRLLHLKLLIFCCYYI